MLLRSNKGFTLVELLVVMAIMGILAAALTTQVKQARKMGQAIRCKANLKNLAQAAINYAVDRDDNLMPWAGSHEVIDAATGWDGDLKKYYHLRPGWVSWIGGGPWVERHGDESRPCARSSVAGKDCTFYGDKDNVYRSITNGTLWVGLGRDLSTYVCSTHKSVANRNGMKDVMRSYVMNSYFGYDEPTASQGNASRHRYRSLGSLSERGNAGGLLLFAELPAFTPSGGGWNDLNKSSGKAADGVLQMKIIGYNNVADTRYTEEYIGFNHSVGKQYAAHVAYADGHVDVVVAPPPPVSPDMLKNLTFFLCNGADVPADSKDWSTKRTDYEKDK